MKKKLTATTLAIALLSSGTPITTFANEVNSNTTIENTSNSEIINIPDINLKKKLNYTLGKKDLKSDINRAELESISRLDISNSSISDLTGLDAAKNMKYLIASNNNLTNVNPILKNKNITLLSIDSNEIKELPNFSGLTNLKHLSVGLNPVSNLSNIKTAKNIYELHIDGIRSSDFSPIYDLDLAFLNISNTNISDYSFIGKYPKLKEVTLNSNNIEDISFIEKWSNKGFLTRLNLSNNKISNLDPISDLINLKNLSINYNLIEDVTPLKNLNNLESVNIGNNKILDISPLNSLPKTVDISAQNQIIELPQKSTTKTDFVMEIPVVDKDGTNIKESNLEIPSKSSIINNKLSYHSDIAGINQIKIDFKSNNTNLKFSGTVYQNVDFNISSPITIKYNKDFTNKDVVISVEGDSSINKLTMPDGNVVSANKATFPIKKNGIYTFKALNKAGEYKSKNISIDNIDTQKPSFKYDLKPNPDGSKSWILKIYAQDTLSGIKSIQTPEKTIENINNELNFNTSTIVKDIKDYLIKITDRAGNTIDETISITNLPLDASLPVNKVDSTDFKIISNKETNEHYILLNLKNLKNLKSIDTPRGNVIASETFKYPVTKSGLYSINLNFNDGSSNEYNISVPQTLFNNNETTEADLNGTNKETDISTIKGDTNSSKNTKATNSDGIAEAEKNSTNSEDKFKNGSSSDSNIDSIDKNNPQTGDRGIVKYIVGLSISIVSIAGFFLYHKFKVK